MSWEVTYIIECLLSVFCGIGIGRALQTYDRLRWLIKGKYKVKYKIQMYFRIFFFCSNKCMSCAYYTVHGKDFCEYNTGIKCKDYVNDKDILVNKD